MVEEKQRLLADVRPACRLSWRGLDLSETAARAALLDEFADNAKRTLVITEGLLLYLEEAVVHALALDLRNRPGIRWWIFDLASPNLLSLMQSTMGTQFSNAPMKFAPANGVAFLEALGWTARPISEAFSAKRRGCTGCRYSCFHSCSFRNRIHADWGMRDGPCSKYV